VSCLTIRFATFNAVTTNFAPAEAARTSAAIVVGVEAALLALGAILYVALGVVGTGSARELSLALAVMAAAGGVGLGCLARGLWRARRWAVSPALTWQVLQGFAGAYAIGAGYAVLGVVAVALAVAGAVALIVVARGLRG